SALRRVLGSEANGTSWIETLPRRGYRYTGPRIAIVNDVGTVPQASPALPEKPSVAVLPFANPGADRKHAHFADGLGADIITALAGFKLVFGIGRNSSFGYKGRTVEIKLVGRELGVPYVVEGRIRISGNKLGVTVQLIDAESGYQLWSE